MSEDPVPSSGTAAASGTPPRRVLFKPPSIILGLLSGLGFAVLLQQYAVTPLTITLLVSMGILGALIFGVGLPTLFLHMHLRRGRAAQKEVPK